MTRTLPRIALTLALVGWAALAPAATTIPEFNAVYDLRKGPLTLGRAELEFDRLGSERYRYRMHTRAVGVARLFYSSEVREVSRGHITERGFRPDLYRYVRTGDDKARTAELRFDWSANQVVNDVGDYPWRMEIPDDAMDRVVGTLQLMHDLDAGDVGETLTYRIADGGELKTYRLTVEGRQTVETPLGRFETLKIVRRDEDGDSVTTLWSAPELHYLPVRIEHWDEDDGSFYMVMTELEGMTLQAAAEDEKDRSLR